MGKDHRHPFYVQGKGWVAAKDLKIGDKLELQNGKDALVDAIHREKLTEPIQVFNFEVAEFHTYFVGEQHILVHNTCSDSQIDTYGNVKKTTKGTGMEAHHIVEKRFAKVLGLKPNQMPSVGLTKAQHRIYTNAWRTQLPYGGNYTVSQISNAASVIYKTDLHLLEAAMRIFE